MFDSMAIHYIALQSVTTRFIRILVTEENNSRFPRLLVKFYAIFQDFLTILILIYFIFPSQIEHFLRE